MSKEDSREIASVLRNSLIKRLGQERYELWFGDCVKFDVEPGALVVSTTQGFLLDRIKTGFRRELAETACQLLGQGASVEFRLDAAPPADVGSAAESTMETTEQPRSAIVPRVEPADTADVKSAAPPSRAPYRRFAALESFVVGDGNRLALTAAESVVKRPGAVTPLLLYGPTGCGKTHLLEGVWTGIRRRSHSRRVVLLSAEQFTTYFVEALRGSGLPSFRRKYRDAELLLIDDVQFLVGKRATIVELQHTIDAFVRAGRQLVLTADRPPAELAGLGPEITTRLSGGLVCGIEPLDQPTRLGVLRQLAARSARPIPDDTLLLLAERLNGDARTLSGAINRLTAASEALQQPITGALAQQALADIFRSTHRVVRMSDVEQVVCELFGVPPETLQSPGKSRVASQPRMLAMWLARKHTRAAFSEIGQHFGRRSHSTVISAEKKVNHWRASGAELQLAHGTCAVDDAIRRLELRLQCG